MRPSSPEAYLSTSRSRTTKILAARSCMPPPERARPVLTRRAALGNLPQPHAPDSCCSSVGGGRPTRSNPHPPRGHCLWTRARKQLDSAARTVACGGCTDVHRASLPPHGPPSRRADLMGVLHVCTRCSRSSTRHNRARSLSLSSCRH
jgi:hypothetical protein